MTKHAKSKIYTRTGDKGKTSLFGGKRISKDSSRIEAIGTIDELNSILGVSSSFISNKKVLLVIQKIQNNLFNIGAELANPQEIGKDTNSLIGLGKGDIDLLESIIDQYDSKLPSLKYFILPGGINSASLLHLSRSVSRRAERRIISISKINPNILSYLNRLSDLLFVLARYLNNKSKIKDIPWEK